MAYRIVYGPEPRITQIKRPGSNQFRVMTSVFFLLFVFLVKLYWPEGRSLLESILLPGEPGATQLALEKLISGLGTGASVADAFRVFCEDIIIHGS